MEYLKTDDTVKFALMFGIDARQQTATLKMHLGKLYNLLLKSRKSAIEYMRYLDSERQ